MVFDCHWCKVQLLDVTLTLFSGEVATGKWQARLVNLTWLLLLLLFFFFLFIFFFKLVLIRKSNMQFKMTISNALSLKII